VILDEGLYDEAFIREQTDLPFLIRQDTGRFLRERDLKPGGSDEVLYVFDTARNTITAAPTTTLELGGIVPALEGRFEAETLQGKITVRPVFELLKEKLSARYVPELAAAITGVSPDLIRRLAREIATAKAVANVTSSNWSKYYHGNLIERSQILLLAVCGHMGKKGSGFSAFPFLCNDGFDPFIFMERAGTLGRLSLQARLLRRALTLKWRGFTDEMVTYEIMRQFYEEGRWVSGTIFWNVHGGLLELANDSRTWDPHLKRDVRAHLDEALEKRWQFVFPPPGKPPRVIFEAGSNILRRLRGYPKLFTHLFPHLRALVTLDSRMTSTGLYSDYVLPVTAWYERTEHKWVTPLMPFIHAGRKMSSFHEAKSDWEITALLAKKIQERATSRAGAVFTDRRGDEKRLDTLYDDFTLRGTYTETDEDKVAGELLKLSTNFEGVEWEELKKKGYARFTAVGGSAVSIGNACDIEPGQSISPFQWHTEKKMIYPTLTRRIQFYIDHDLYLELGEELPLHKDAPTAGGDYPLMMTGGHARWSIHASWRDDALMLRQQRGVPVMYMSITDATARSITDGDEVEVRNDIDTFRIHAKVSPAVRPGQLIIYHAWENHQFKDRRGFQNLIPSPINPVELAGGQFHLRPMFICLHPGQSDRDTRVEVTKAV
jgi:anaerobic selenocysteine-containing dehydrogenase